MDFGASQTALQKSAAKSNLLLLLCLFLLVSNVILATVIFRIAAQKSVIITPAVINKPFTISSTHVDVNYLRQMSLFFVNTRLNVTPETVNGNNQLLLQYISSKFYHQFSSMLLNEAREIELQKISSVFYPNKTSVYLSQLTVVIDGTLKRYVGSREIQPEIKRYIIKYTYKSGVLKIISFAEEQELAAQSKNIKSTEDAEQQEEEI